MSGDILNKIDETLTFYSAGLSEEITVPVEGPTAPAEPTVPDVRLRAWLEIKVSQALRRMESWTA